MAPEILCRIADVSGCEFIKGSRGIDIRRDNGLANMTSGLIARDADTAERHFRGSHTKTVLLSPTGVLPYPLITAFDGWTDREQLSSRSPTKYLTAVGKPILLRGQAMMNTSPAHGNRRLRVCMWIFMCTSVISRVHGQNDAP